MGSAVVEHVSLRERDAGVAVLTVDRPPANAMDLTLLRDVLDAIRQITSDPPRALVPAGRLGFFSSGVDLKVMPGHGLRSSERWSRASTPWRSATTSCRAQIPRSRGARWSCV
jgi:enoyl-CoA hydratase/carnithine racemase